MNDRSLFELARGADPLAAGVGEPPLDLLERVLASPRRESRPRRVHGWQGRFVLVAVVLGLSAVIASLAIAGTGWLVGSPAPPSVQSDFGAYPTPVGPQPQPGQAVLVASNGDYQLYATVNTQRGLCMLVSAPWNRPVPNGGGGLCVASTPDASPFWAGVGGIAGAAPGKTTTVVVAGHTTDGGASSVRFDAPDGETVTAPVRASGFFVVGTPYTSPMCSPGAGAWTPRFTVLDSSGHQLSATSITLFPGARTFPIPGRGQGCAAVANGPFGSSSGQLPLDG